MNKINALLAITSLCSLSLHAMQDAKHILPSMNQEKFKNWASKRRKEVILSAPKALLSYDQIYKEAEENERDVAIINATQIRAKRKTRNGTQSDPGSAKNMMTLINEKQKSADFEDPELDRFAAGVALTEFAKPLNDVLLFMLEYFKREESIANNKPIEKTDESLDNEPVEKSNEIRVKIVAQNRSPVVEKNDDEIMDEIIHSDELAIVPAIENTNAEALAEEIKTVVVIPQLSEETENTRVESDEDAPIYDFNNYDEDLFTAIPPSPLEVAPIQNQDVSSVAAMEIVLVQNPIEESAPSPFEVVPQRSVFQDQMDEFKQALQKHSRLKGKQLLDALENEITIKDPITFLMVAQASNCKEAIDFAAHLAKKRE